MTGSLASLLGVGDPGCPVCGSDCDGHPEVRHLITYPFLPGGLDPMADKDYIRAPHRIVDHDLERVVYGTGDRVPIADAIKYGLIEPEPSAAAATDPAEDETEDKPTSNRRSRRGPAEDRAKRPAEDR